MNNDSARYKFPFFLIPPYVLADLLLRGEARWPGRGVVWLIVKQIEARELDGTIPVGGWKRAACKNNVVNT